MSNEVHVERFDSIFSDSDPATMWYARIETPWGRYGMRFYFDPLEELGEDNLYEFMMRDARNAHEYQSTVLSPDGVNTNTDQG